MPGQGIMFRRCSVCKVELPPVAVAHDDPANGGTSHGYCALHEAEALTDLANYLKGYVVLFIPTTLLWIGVS